MTFRRCDRVHGLLRVWRDLEPLPCFQRIHHVGGWMTKRARPGGHDDYQRSEGGGWRGIHAELCNYAGFKWGFGWARGVGATYQMSGFPRALPDLGRLVGFQTSEPIWSDFVILIEWLRVSARRFSDPGRRCPTNCKGR